MGKGAGERTAAMQSKEEREEAIATLESWKLVLGFTKMAAVRCAIELGIADVIDTHGGAATLPQLSAAIGCTDPGPLRRVMRFLVHHKIFKMTTTTTTTTNHASKTYLQTPLSRRLMKGSGGGSEEKSMADFIMLESSWVMLAPWLAMSKQVLSAGPDLRPFELAHGGLDLWGYTGANPGHSKLFDDGMACDARLAVRSIVGSCPEVFEGVETVVDVGGGNGTAMAMLVKSFPEIRAINFDLPHVVSAAPKWDGVEHVGGDMFVSVPNANVACFMKVLHDWTDSQCIEILKNCRDAIVANNSSSSPIRNKVVIVDSVVDENEDEEEEDKELSWTEVKLGIDMVMIAHTNGGIERTQPEWAHVLHQSGFLTYTIKPTSSYHSVIEAFP